MVVNDIRRAWEDVMDLALDLEDWGKLKEIRDSLRGRRIELLKNGPFVGGNRYLPTEFDVHTEMALDVVLEYEDLKVARGIKDELRRVRLIDVRCHRSELDRDVSYAITEMSNLVLPAWACMYLRDLDSAEERLLTLLDKGRRGAIERGILGVPMGPKMSKKLVYDYAREVKGWDRSELDDCPGSVDMLRTEIRGAIAFARERGLLGEVHQVDDSPCNVDGDPVDGGEGAGI